MRKICLAIFLGLLGFFPRESRAQVAVEETVKTDSIDVFADAQKAPPSITWPLLATAVLPGLGHEMLKKENRAMAYLSADALLIFTGIFCEATARGLFKNATAFAYTYAGTQGGPGADDIFWSNVSKYNDSNGLDAASAGYNQTQEIDRTFDQKYIADNLQWRWQEPADDLRGQFTKMLTTSTQFHVAATFCVAALIANRVVSMIDLRVTSRQRAITGHAAAGAPLLRLRPYYDATRDQTGLVLSAAF